MSDRPRIPRAQRIRIFLRDNKTCQKCECELDMDTFHVAHLRSHAHGGPAVDENLQAWCAPCNQQWGNQDVLDPRMQPREWQTEALDVVIRRISERKMATVSAAPGAGKTVFAGLVFNALYDADLVDRLVVMAPRTTLISQWAKSLERNCHISLKPNDAYERPRQSGVVVSYQSLVSQANVQNHVDMVSHGRTLLILDEVHHIGERAQNRAAAAWARGVKEIAGDVDGEILVAGVLNLSGTLWRSDRNERISTVNYIDLGNRRIQAEADYTVPAKLLIQQGHLRPIDLWTVDGRVEVRDTKEFTITESEISDLDEDDSRAVLAELPKNAEYRAAFVNMVLNQLEKSCRSLNNHHAKALIVASRQEDAAEFRDEVNKQMRERGLRPLAELAVSNNKDYEEDTKAAVVLENFRKSQRPGVLCTVGMAGEGYDCPDITVVGFASNKLTPQFIYQVVARAQRVTDVERETQVIPAVVVIPPVKSLMDALTEYLLPYNPDVLVEEQRERETDGSPQPLPWRRLEVNNIEVTSEESIYSDGEGNILYRGDASSVDEYGQILELHGVPAMFATRILATNETLVAKRPWGDVPDVDGHLKEDKKRRMGVEEHAKTLQSQLHKLEQWVFWDKNANGPKFVAQVNESADIPNGGRERASITQLALALDFATAWIRDYCAKTGKKLPKTLQDAV